MYDDDVILIVDPPAPALARRADLSAPSARVVRDRRPILAEIDEGRPWLELSARALGIVAVAAMGIAAVVLAYFVVAAVWTLVLPIVLMAAVLKSAKPSPGRG